LSLKAKTEIEDLSQAVKVLAELHEKGSLERALRMMREDETSGGAGSSPKGL